VLKFRDRAKVPRLLTIARSVKTSNVSILQVVITIAYLPKAIYNILCLSKERLARSTRPRVTRLCRGAVTLSSLAAIDAARGLYRLLRDHVAANILIYIIEKADKLTLIFILAASKSLTIL
jgi:hypothetical protein